ncbi:hypothetical protein AB0C84_44915 [Actinomadura sp. NPDC048955]|uniref:hypothetical protein n=1 Tax=Actinomadura sp. NPDC048955 TaxID=3158228 RepID=UPI0033D31E43
MNKDDLRSGATSGVCVAVLGGVLGYVVARLTVGYFGEFLDLGPIAIVAPIAGVVGALVGFLVCIYGYIEVLVPFAIIAAFAFAMTVSFSVPAVIGIAGATAAITSLLGAFPVAVFSR